MPGEKGPHHTDEFKKCVADVQAGGKSEDSAYAICTTTFKKKGNPIFVNASANSAEEEELLRVARDISTKAREEMDDDDFAGPHRSFPIAKPEDVMAAVHSLGRAGGDAESIKAKIIAICYRKGPEFVNALPDDWKRKKDREAEESRELVLCGTFGTVQYKKLHGRDHIVIPVVALVEGVIHASNASSAEYVPLNTIKQAAASFNGRPITVGHPVRGGISTSANAPDIHDSYAIGTVFNSRVEGKKLLCDAWVDVEKAKTVDRDLFARLEAGKINEVSVGALVIANHESGTYGSRDYKGTWLDASGDHLAFLTRGNGACSIAMGCGTHRAAMRHLVTAEGIESDPTATLTALLRALMPRGWGDDEVKKDLADALYAVEPAARNGDVLRVTNHSIVYAIYPQMSEATAYSPSTMPKIQYFSRDYSFNTATQKFEIESGRQEVEPTTVYEPIRMAASPSRIKYEGGKYVLYSTQDNSLKLFEYASRSLAEDHERAIEAALARRTSSTSCQCGNPAAHEGA